MRTSAIRLSLLLALAPAAPAAAQERHARGHDHHHPASADEVRQVKHPDPRPGLTAAVLGAREHRRERHREVYRMAREIPAVLDGLYCHCDCHDRDGLRSLLDCFRNGMFESCGICQSQARLAYRLHAEGKTLTEIRAAVDARFGGR